MNRHTNRARGQQHTPTQLCPPCPWGRATTLDRVNPARREAVHPVHPVHPGFAPPSLVEGEGGSPARARIGTGEGLDTLDRISFGCGLA